MAECDIIKEILSSYIEIQILNEDDGIMFFKLKEKEYGIWYPEDGDKISHPIILVKNDSQFDYPHVLPFEVPLDEDKQNYRFICLHESGSIINYLMSYEEKIIEAIERLIQLLSLTPLEIEEEFQKEFLYYWNEQTEILSDMRLFIAADKIFQKMNVYKSKDEIFRAVGSGIKLNDKGATYNKWIFVPYISAFYIPIIDNRRILPPVKDNPWRADDILRIIKGKDISRISHETYELIKKEKVKSNRAFLVFELMVENRDIIFCCMIRFKNSETTTLLDKLDNNIEEIVPMKTTRCDYYFLNKQIGNDTSIIGKTVAIIGVGSLGSYLATELVKSGIKNLVLYDGDTLEESNIMRHRAGFFWSHSSKSIAMKYDLESMHPEIEVTAKKESLTEEILKGNMHDYDMIIFTVGSSDIQLAANAVFKDANYNKPVIFSWLEAGGANSHILVVDYSQNGCFECLYTDNEGNLINNKVNVVSDELVERNTIRNSCGATRVAYGTEILLRTTSVILDTVKKIFNREFRENCLIDIDPASVIIQGNTFKEGKCHCCGDRDSE